MEYLHGGDIYSVDKNVIDFSSNINPLGIPKNVKEAIMQSIDFISVYPDFRHKKFKCAAAKKEGISEKNIICANGAAELIFNIAFAVCPKKVLIISPSFSEYERAADAVGADKIFYTAKEDENFEVGYDLTELLENADMAYICNPNNPTGKSLKKELLKEICKFAEEKNIITVIDESFGEFTQKYSENSAVRFASEHKNVFVIKSLTKIFALPGLRIGYAVCGNSSIIESINSVRQCWNVSCMALSAGTAAMSENSFVKSSAEYIKKERLYMESAFEKAKIKYFASEANFILFKHKEDTANKLLEKGILIRNCKNFRSLGGEYYRAAVKSHSDNEKFINALSEI